MENTLNEYLPEYILDGLTLRLIDKLGNFYPDCTPKNNPDVIKACRSIEQNVQQVYSVIANAKRSMNTNPGGYGYRYRHFLTSVYILLYYRHRDDEPYIMVVFPQLKSEMGDFAAKTIIKEVVGKMLEEDAKLRSLEENKNAEDEDIREKGKKNEVKRLTPAHAGLFCEALLDYHNCKYTNKKQSIAPLASSMFGWAITTMERNVSSYTPEDREYVANLFKELNPDFSSFVKNYGNKRANLTPQGDSK